MAITMATGASSSDVHMATAAVGTEGGGGRRRTVHEESRDEGGFWMLTHTVASWKVFDNATH